MLEGSAPHLHVISVLSFVLPVVFDLASAVDPVFDFAVLASFDLCSDLFVDRSADSAFDLSFDPFSDPYFDSAAVAVFVAAEVSVQIQDCILYLDPEDLTSMHLCNFECCLQFSFASVAYCQDYGTPGLAKLRWIFLRPSETAFRPHHTGLAYKGHPLN